MGITKQRMAWLGKDRKDHLVPWAGDNYDNLQIPVKVRDFFFYPGGKEIKKKKKKRELRIEAFLF